MNYLKSNLSYSQILPYDVMKLIYEYADPIDGIRKKFDNKEYDLDEIMYNRMKKEILKRLNNGLGEYKICVCDDNLGNYYIPSNYREIIIDKNNIDDILQKDLIINGQCGYKDFYLYQRLRKTKICGLEPHYGIISYRTQMIKDLKVVKPDVRYETRSIKQLYKLWAKL
jgi:hypothetical protein